jgi:Na+-transporting NADH:ubiquinone oxidoreductase subunit C
VDGLAGATITSRGVTAMLRFWLGEHGFGPYLDV